MDVKGLRSGLDPKKTKKNLLQKVTGVFKKTK
jgi:hypothetical protein